MNEIKRWVTKQTFWDHDINQGAKHYGEVLRHCINNTLYGWIEKEVWPQAKPIMVDKIPLFEFPEIRMGLTVSFTESPFNKEIQLVNEVRSVVSENKWLTEGRYAEPSRTPTFASWDVYSTTASMVSIDPAVDSDKEMYRTSGILEGKNAVKAAVKPVIQQLEELKAKWVKEPPEKWDLLEVASILGNLQRAIS